MREPRKISQRERDLIRERDLLRLVIDNSADHIYVKDTQSRFLVANDMVVRYLGAGCREDLIGKTDFDFHPPEMAARYFADEQAIFRSGQALINHEEPIFNHATGEQNWLSTNKVPFRDAEGRIVGLVGINRDLTALKQSMNELKITQAQLALTEKVAALSGVVAGMAHEMNTPVGVSVTAASFIQDTLNDFQRDLSPGLPPHPGLDLLIAKLQESAGIIVRNLDRVAKEIHLFKDIAVYQTGEDRQELHLLPYLQDIAMSLRSRLRSGGHQLKIDCPEELWIKQYPGALVQIIANLSANALVHAFEHQAKGVISIEVSWREPNVHLEFSDNGQGMAPEVLQHLFEPFFTTKRGSGGTGLGLTVVYNLVTQRLGGSISCRSAPGQGTSFRIIFPRLGLASDRD